MITDHQKCYKGSPARICWTAILAGAFVGMGLSFLLSIYSTAIGLSAYSASPNGAMAIAIGGVIGLIIGVIVAMGVAGFVAGYLGRFHYCYCHGGVLYGFITWSIIVMLTALLIMPMGHYVSFYKESINPALSSTEVSTTDVNASVNQQANLTSQQVVNANAKNLAWSGWIIFILFFLGAISSCIGACYGMCCKKEDSVSPPVSGTSNL